MSARIDSPLGAKLPHESALRHVSGEARYVDDLPEPEGLLHGMVLPAPVAHARIRGIVTTAATEVPGVHAVLTAAGGAMLGVAEERRKMKVGFAGDRNGASVSVSGRF